MLLEAFKGDRYDFRAENIARNWATAYDFPAVREGRVVLEEFPVRATRHRCRPSCSTCAGRSSRTERVRRAFNLAFDFEDINRTLFYGLYERVDSFFDGTELASAGLPQGKELAILEGPARQGAGGGLHEPYQNPVERLAREGAGATCARPCGC